MKKLALSVGALVLLLAILAGCGTSGKPLPEGMDEEAVLKAGREVVMMLVKGDYESAYNLLRQDQKDRYTVEDVQALLLKQLDGAGVYKDIQDTLVTGRTTPDEEIAVALFSCNYSEKDVLIQVSFDHEMTLLGFSVQKQ